MLHFILATSVALDATAGSLDNIHIPTNQYCRSFVPPGSEEGSDNLTPTVNLYGKRGTRLCLHFGNVIATAPLSLMIMTKIDH